MATPGEKEVEQRLIQMVKDISVALDHHKRVADQLTRAIQRGLSGTRFSVDHVQPGGSYARRTATKFKLDVDMPILMNGLAGASEKEFDQARDMLEDALLRDETLDIPLTAVKVVDGAMAVKVKFKGIDFDLIPTPTFSQSKKEQVRQSVLATVKNNGSRLYAGALIDASNEFACQQSARCHDFCKLAKFWQQNLTYFGYVPGRSYMFELIAMSVAREVEENLNGKKIFFVTCFKQFLHKVQNIDQIKITFPEFLRSSFGLSLPKGLPRDPGVYPPENPWKNLLAEIPANFKTLVRNAAIETAMTLDRILFGQVDFGSLIEPRPKLFEAPKAPKLTGYLVGLRENANKLMFPEFKINNKKKPNIKPGVFGPIAKELAGALVGHEQEDGATKKIENQIDKYFRGENTNWTPCNESFDSRDVVVTIPIAKTNKVVLVGFNIV